MKPFLQRKSVASRSKSTNDAVVPNERRLFAKKKSGGRDKSEEGCLRTDTWRRRLQRRKAAIKKDGSEGQELPALSRSKSLDLTSAKSIGSAGVLAQQEDTSTLPKENSPISFDDGRQSSDVGKNIFKGAFSALSSSTRGNFHVSSPAVAAAAAERAGDADNRSFDAIEVVDSRQPQTVCNSSPTDKPKLARTMSEFIQVVQGTTDHGESLPSSTVAPQIMSTTFWYYYSSVTIS